LNLGKSYINSAVLVVFQIGFTGDEKFWSEEVITQFNFTHHYMIQAFGTYDSDQDMVLAYLLIRDSKGNIIYSNLPKDFGAMTDDAKSFKNALKNIIHLNEGDDNFDSIADLLEDLILREDPSAALGSVEGDYYGISSSAISLKKLPQQLKENMHSYFVRNVYDIDPAYLVYSKIINDQLDAMSKTVSKSKQELTASVLLFKKKTT
jgi:hypothetical protein